MEKVEKGMERKKRGMEVAKRNEGRDGGKKEERGERPVNE